MVAETSTDGTAAVAGTARRRRTGKKRLKFSPPAKFPRGVRELWQSATVEEQTKAHRTCIQILTLWLGKRRREEVASELSLPPLRVWQLSQQALAGMLAGLLHQPRPRRRSMEATMESASDDVRALQKRVAEQERQITNLEDLLRLFTNLPKLGSEPSAREVLTPVTKTDGSSRRRRARRGEAEGAELPRGPLPEPR
jgi:hypothetical protein